MSTDKDSPKLKPLSALNSLRLLLRQKRFPEQKIICVHLC